MKQHDSHQGIHLHWMLVVGLLSFAVGCGDAASKHRVESTTARQVLENVLKGWQNGDSIDAWREKQPSVVIQDMDWKRGVPLQSFEIIGDGDAVDANLYCQVKLKFAKPQNGKSEQVVTYLVGTSPVLTVFRSPGL